MSIEVKRLHLGATPGDAEIRPEHGPLPPGQAADEDAWHASVNGCGR